MKQHIYITGLVLVEYIGEKPVPLIGRELKEKVTLNKGDMFVTTPTKAMGLCGGTKYRYVKGVTDIAAFLSESQSSENSEEDNNIDSNDSSEDLENSEEDKKTTTNFILTKENIVDADIQAIKDYLKSKKVKVGNKKRDDLIALAIPFLDNEASLLGA